MFGIGKNKKTQNPLNSHYYLKPKGKKFSIIFSDYDPEAILQKCRNYFESLTLEQLVKEQSRVINFIGHKYEEYRGDNNSEVLVLNHFVFPCVLDSKNRLYY